MTRPSPTAPRALLRLSSVLVLVALLAAGGAARAETAAQARASWLLARATGSGPADPRLFQAEIGGVAAGPEQEPRSTGGKAGLKVLASAVLPGAGEVLSGYRRGYVMMAVDIFAWTRVFKYNSDGDDLSDAYYVFADAHYTDELLVEGYNPNSIDQERSGEGAIYFPTYPAIYDVFELDEKLPLYVSKEDDRREYYENLGKWDQFIFGWDDYTRASVAHPEYEYEPTRTTSDLQQPWVSRNREIYRDMRDAANDAYKTRDRWLYVNIGLRVFSVLQTAWLNGLLGGGDDEAMSLLGHEVNVAAVPAGPTSGSVHAAVSF